MKLLLIFVLGFSLITFTANAQKFTFEHEVSQGETVSGIAKKYNISIKTIEQFNQDLNVNSISIGQKLTIPSSKDAEYITKTYGIAPSKIQAVLKGDDKPIVFDSEEFKQDPIFNRKNSSSKRATVNPHQQTNNYIKHYVKEGETLFSLSKKYNVPVDSIKTWNNLNGDFLPVSEYVIIGKKGVTYYASDKPVNTVQEFETQEKLKDGQVHIVKQGETLYSLSKKYGISIKEIKHINKFENNDIQIGQIIFLTKTPESQSTPTNAEGNPTRPPVFTENNETEANPNRPPVNVEKGDTENTTTRPPVNIENMRPVLHEVQPSETLYQIAKQYNKSPQQIKNWNKLTSNHIETGDKIIVGYFKEENTASDYNENNTFGQSQKYMRIYDIKHRRTDAYKLMKESGMAAWIPKSGAADNNLYVLHKTAPVNSIIKVVNPMNKRVVYVKVIGQLQNKIGEEMINMKLTAEAVKRLQLLDDRFRLEWSYHIQK